MRSQCHRCAGPEICLIRLGSASPINCEFLKCAYLARAGSRFYLPVRVPSSKRKLLSSKIAPSYRKMPALEI